MAGLMRWLGQGLTVGGAVVALMTACSASSGANGSGGSGAAASGGSGAAASGGSGAAASGGGISFGGQGAGTGSGGSGAAGGGCGFQTYDGKQRPLDMYVLMDESGSMDGTSWNAVKGALTTFVKDPSTAGIGVGLQFFPTAAQNCQGVAPCPPGCIQFPILNICVAGMGTAECDVNSYLPPAVMIQPLPGVAQQLINAMNSQTPDGDTPTLPAMQSAITATAGYAKQYPTHKVIIVLATDGEPNACNSTVSAVSSEAAKGLPLVETFVIGIGSGLSNLDQIAQAGGSGKAIIVDTSGGSQQFINAMNQIRGSALGCQYQIPTGANADPNKVNVFYTPKNGQGGYILYVTSAAQCKGGPGWYYDRDAQGNPTGIELCPASCSTVQQGGGKMDIQVGCQTHAKPPA